MNEISCNSIILWWFSCFLKKIQMTFLLSLFKMKNYWEFFYCNLRCPMERERGKGLSFCDGAGTVSFGDVAIHFKFWGIQIITEKVSDRFNFLSLSLIFLQFSFQPNNFNMKELLQADCSQRFIFLFKQIRQM